MSSGTGSEKSTFNITCTLLSRYLKSSTGDLVDQSPDLNLPPESKAQETPRTMNLLPGLESAANSEDAPPWLAPMTIFYDGKVMVFDHIPSKKAKDLIAMIGRVSPATVNSAPIHDASTPSSTSGCGVAGSAHLVVHPQKAAMPSASDLPIARRASLNRFLEKRKHRISSKAPYQLSAALAEVDCVSSSVKVEEKRPWLALAPSKLEDCL